MAKYIVSDPSGQTHVIEGPDGASPAEVIAQAQKVVPYKPTAGIGGVKSNMPQQPPMPQTMPQGMPQGQPQIPPQAQAPSAQMPGQQPQGGGADQQKMLIAYMLSDPDGAKKLIGQMIQQKMGVSSGKQSSPWRVVPGMLSKSGKPIQQNEQTGEVREASLDVTPTGRGNSAFQPQGGVRMTSPTDPSKSEYYHARATSSDVNSMATIEKNIDPSHAPRTTPIGAAATSVRRAVNGLSLLQQPTVTNTALTAVVGDLDSIVTQGAATVEGRKALGASNVYAKIQQLKSQVAAHPENTPVPDSVVKLYKNILTDLGPVSQKFVSDYVDQQSFLYKKKALSLMGPKEYDGLKKRVLDSYDIDKALGAAGGGDQTQAYSDPGKEARYQAYLKAHPNGQ